MVYILQKTESIEDLRKIFNKNNYDFFDLDIYLNKNMDYNSGYLINNDDVVYICDTIMKYQKTSKSKKNLYSTFMELISNTIEHAYEDKSQLGKWHVFIENNKDRVKITFLDTGIGIPNSIRRKCLNDKSKNFDMSSDTQVLINILKGFYKFNHTGRGHGLPSIFELYMNKDILNLTVISGKGYCNFDNDKYICLGNEVHGTLLYWEILKAGDDVEAFEE